MGCKQNVSHIHRKASCFVASHCKSPQFLVWLKSPTAFRAHHGACDCVDLHRIRIMNTSSVCSNKSWKRGQVTALRSPETDMQRPSIMVLWFISISVSWGGFLSLCGQLLSVDNKESEWFYVASMMILSLFYLPVLRNIKTLLTSAQGSLDLNDGWSKGVVQKAKGITGQPDCVLVLMPSGWRQKTKLLLELFSTIGLWARCWLLWVWRPLFLLIYSITQWSLPACSFHRKIPTPSCTLETSWSIPGTDTSHILVFTMERGMAFPTWLTWHVEVCSPVDFLIFISYFGFCTVLFWGEILSRWKCCRV